MVGKLAELIFALLVNFQIPQLEYSQVHKFFHSSRPLVRCYLADGADHRINTSICDNINFKLLNLIQQSNLPESASIIWSAATRTSAINATAMKLLDLLQENRTGLKKVVWEVIRICMFSPWMHLEHVIGLSSSWDSHSCDDENIDRSSKACAIFWKICFWPARKRNSRWHSLLPARSEES